MRNLTFESVSRPLSRTPPPHPEVSSSSEGESELRKSSRKKVASAKAKDSIPILGKRGREDESILELSAWDGEEERKRRLVRMGKSRWEKEQRGIREGETVAGFLYGARGRREYLIS